jgi:hypothetical protein
MSAEQLAPLCNYAHLTALCMLCCFACVSAVHVQPKYEAYMKLFEPLCGPAPQRPILTEGANKVRRTHPWALQVDVRCTSSSVVEKHGTVACDTCDRYVEYSHACSHTDALRVTLFVQQVQCLTCWLHIPRGMASLCLKSCPLSPAFACAAAGCCCGSEAWA